MSELPITVSRTVLAHLLGISIRRLSEHAAEGHLVRVGRGEFDLQRSIQGYAAMLETRAAARGAPSAADRLAEQKAAEIGARIARQERDLIWRADALEDLDEVSKHFIESVGRIPSLLGELDERTLARAKAVCSEEQAVLRHRFADARAALETGQPRRRGR